MGGKAEEGARAAVARVLVVDDNLQLAENIAEILEIEGFETDVSGSAEEALAKALAADLDALVTDYRLPGMSGAEFVRAVRQRRADIHAVVISAYTDEQTVGDARAAGAAFLPKPLDLARLRQIVREN